MGGTTTWERWDSLLPNATVNPGEMTSFNHYAFGSVAAWIHATVGGLSPARPGWAVVKVAPVPGGGITAATAEYLSPYGRVVCKWWAETAAAEGEQGGGQQEVMRQRGDGLYLQVTVPPNSRAEVTVPGANETVEVGSGFYEWFVEGFEVPE